MRQGQKIIYFLCNLIKLRLAFLASLMFDALFVRVMVKQSSRKHTLEPFLRSSPLSRTPSVASVVSACGLTQSQGELVEALQFGHKGADGVPGLLLQSEVAGVLDGLQAAKHRCSLTKKKKMVLKTTSDLTHSFK